MFSQSCCLLFEILLNPKNVSFFINLFIIINSRHLTNSIRISQDQNSFQFVQYNVKMINKEIWQIKDITCVKNTMKLYIKYLVLNIILLRCN